MKAVIPAAGLGTRFGAATKAQPKEMLVAYDKPVIQYVVEEVVKSGIDDIIIISGRKKRSIEDHFDKDVELEMILKNNGKEKELKQIQEISEMAKIVYVRQKEQKGLGDAVYYAKSFIGNEPFSLLLGDTITIPSCTKQLLDAFYEHKSSVIAVEKVPREQVSKYGIVEIDSDYKIKGLVEKPKPESAPSDLAILGRYILTPEVFDCIKKTKAGYGGEIQLTDALQLLLKKQDIYALEYVGRRHDIGNIDDLVKTSIEFALNGEHAAEMESYLKDVIAKKNLNQK